MTDHEDYLREQAVLDATRVAALSHRLTYTIVQTRLREAAMEGAVDQVAYLEERSDVLAPPLATDTQRVAALTAAVEQLRVRAVAVATEDLLAALRTTVRAIDAQVQRLRADLAAAVALAARAQQYADALPQEQLPQRIAANEIGERLRAMDELASLLYHLAGQPHEPEK